jgi:hypothetical protein
VLEADSVQRAEFIGLLFLIESLFHFLDLFHFLVHFLLHHLVPACTSMIELRAVLPESNNCD